MGRNAIVRIVSDDDVRTHLTDHVPDFADYCPVEQNDLIIVSQETDVSDPKLTGCFYELLFPLLDQCVQVGLPPAPCSLFDRFQVVRKPVRWGKGTDPVAQCNVLCHGASRIQYGVFGVTSDVQDTELLTRHLSVNLLNRAIWITNRLVAPRNHTTIPPDPNYGSFR